MANKKLKIELELETAKAKRQLKGMESSAGASAGGGETAVASDQAAKSIKNLATSANTAHINLKSATRAFAGIAVGLAGSYAATHVKDPTAKSAIGIGSGAVVGASMGAMVAGPYGAAAGGILGAIKAWMDQEGERAKMSQDFEKGEARYQSSRAQMERLKDLTDPRRGGGTAAQLPTLQQNYQNNLNSAESFLEQIREELEKCAPDTDKIEALKANLDDSRKMADLYKQAIDEIKEKGSGDPAGSRAATDALTKIGGNFTSTYTAWHGIEMTMNKQLEVLREINKVCWRDKDEGIFL